ncbi:hypothetical protein NC652_005051 [Populus alba x Populus x berolinensis]|nr:hypothetical protein NC652_005051 [Populus alba x Populus x berolinensis]
MGLSSFIFSEQRARASFHQKHGSKTKQPLKLPAPQKTVSCGTMATLAGVGWLKRAHFDIVLRRGWARLTSIEKALDLCGMVNRECGGASRGISIEILMKLETGQVRPPIPNANLVAVVQHVPHTVSRSEHTISPDFQLEDSEWQYCKGPTVSHVVYIAPLEAIVKKCCRGGGRDPRDMVLCPDTGNNASMFSKSDDILERGWWIKPAFLLWSPWNGSLSLKRFRKKSLGPLYSTEFAICMRALAAWIDKLCPNCLKLDGFICSLSNNVPGSAFVCTFERHLNHFLHGNFNTESVAGVIENKQDVVGYLTFTFMYRRLTQNPNYYNLRERVTGNFVITLSDQEASKCVLEILSSASEKAQLLIRPGEVKATVLLQAHFSTQSVSGNLALDLLEVLLSGSKIASSNG